MQDDSFNKPDDKEESDIDSKSINSASLSSNSLYGDEYDEEDDDIST